MFIKKIKSVFVLLFFAQIIEAQVALPDISDRINNELILKNHFFKAIYSEELPFDRYGEKFFSKHVDISLKGLSKVSYEELSNINTLSQNFSKSLSDLKTLKNNLNNFDSYYDKSFKHYTESGIIYDYDILKRIYNYLYHDALLSYAKNFQIFQSKLYDSQKNVDIEELFNLSNNFLHNEYLNFKNNMTLLNEVSIGRYLLEEVIILEKYFLDYNFAMCFMNQTMDDNLLEKNWYGNQDLEIFYSSEYLKNLSSILELPKQNEEVDLNTPTALSFLLLDSRNLMLYRLENLWENHKEGKKVGLKSRFKIYDPSVLTEEDIDFLARLNFVDFYREQMLMYNYLAATKYFEGKYLESANYLSYENFYEISIRLLAFHEQTINQNLSYLNENDLDRIEKFLPTVISEYKNYDGYSNINDIGIELLSTISRQLINYAYNFRNNGYSEKYTEIIEIAVSLFEENFSSFSKIDLNNSYHPVIIDNYISRYLRAVEEEIIIYLWHDLLTDYNNEDLVVYARNKIKKIKDLGTHFNVSDQTKKKILYIEDKFELRIGMRHDIIKKNKLIGYQPLKDFEYYKNYFELMKKTKQTDPDWYYGFFGGLIQREGYELISKIFSEDEWFEIYKWNYDLSIDVPTNRNLQNTAQINYQLFGPTEKSLNFLDYGFSVLAKRTSVEELQEFPEKYSSLAWFMKRFAIMQFFIDDRKKTSKDLKEKAIESSFDNVDQMLSSIAIDADNITKAVMHTKKQDLTLMEFVKYNYLEAMEDTTNFGLRHFNFRKYGINGPALVHPDSLLIVSYSFTSEFDRLNADYMINTIGLYHGISPKNHSVLSSVDMYKLEDTLNISKSVLRNNFQDISVGKNNKIIYDALIKPIESELKNYKNIVFIPDPFIENFPLESIKDADGKYLIEKFNISYANSFDQLFNDFYRKRYPKDDITSNVFGNINYDSFSRFETLKWSENEINFIKKSSIFEGDLFNNVNASETNFRKLLNDTGNVQRLHLSMHAYNDLNDVNNSAIIFASDDINDGYLTFSEVKELDFSNVNLIVLSACETNSGKTLNNFNQLTFQYLMKMNGADNVISTLWKIDDKATYCFMKELYSSFNEYFYDTPYALSNAKRNFILKYPEYENPYYWSGFVGYGF